MHVNIKVSNVTRNCILWLIALIGSMRIKNYRSLKRSSHASMTFLVIANHESWWDPIILHAILWKLGIRSVSYMAKQELFKIFLLGPFIRWLGAFPINRDTVDRAGLREATNRLKNNSSVAIFPEGTCKNKEPNEIAPFKPGLAYIWKKTEVSSLCIGIHGSRYRSPVTVAYRIQPYSKDITNEDLREIVADLSSSHLSSHV